jgi:hypothetical protein
VGSGIEGWCARLPYLSSGSGVAIPLAGYDRGRRYLLRENARLPLTSINSLGGFGVARE